VNHQSLKARQRLERHNYPANLTLRVHRALSWLDRAERSEDNDARFIFLWIAFNAAYATEIDERSRLSEQETFKAFLDKLIQLDEHKHIEQMVWTEFSQSIRVLLDNPFVLQAFWDFHNQKISESDWQERLAQGKRNAQKALATHNTAALLGVVFNRIYTLRNQLIHGGATWNSKVNREQLRDCVKLMEKLVPRVITIMMDNPDTLWGDACYPVIEH
jgi:hypothetical protein